MSLLLAGLNHRNGSPAARERLAAVGASAALRALRERGFEEAVALATCNRFEIYASLPSTTGAGERLASFLEETSGEKGACAYLLEGPDAVRHLFEVASGLDSLVLGEAEILGQVKSAYESARDGRMTAKLLNVLFQRALFVGKAVRSRTRIGMGQVSVASAAVELARRIFGGLTGSSALILGAGAVAEQAARHLVGSGLSRVHIANRTRERAEDLARSVGAQAVAWEDFPELLARVDIVLASTGAPRAVLDERTVAAALRARAGRSLFLIDIAMPRDIAEGVGCLEGAYLYRLEDLEAIVRDNLERRRGEIAEARALARLQAEAFGAWLASSERGEAATLRHAPSWARAGAP